MECGNFKSASAASSSASLGRARLPAALEAAGTSLRRAARLRLAVERRGVARRLVPVAALRVVLLPAAAGVLVDVSVDVGVVVVARACGGDGVGLAGIRVGRRGLAGSRGGARRPGGRDRV